MWHAMSVPRGKNCTISNCHVAKTMSNQLNSGVRDLFKTKKIAGTKTKTDPNYRDENHI